MFAAETPCPGCGRMACSSGRNGRSEPSIASMASAAVTSAMVNRCAASWIASSSMASMPSVPLISASPSLAASSIGARPARRSASAAGARSPSGPSTQPSPSSTSAQCASGARSPEAPSEPCSGTHGVTSWLSRSTSASATSGRTPERPRASERTRSSIIARTTSRGIGAPTPAACDRISACWSSARRSGTTKVLARAPKPVETPYTGRPAASMSSTMDRLVAMASTAAGSSTILAVPRATASTSAGETPVGRMVTVIAVLRCAGPGGSGAPRAGRPGAGGTGRRG